MTGGPNSRHRTTCMAFYCGFVQKCWKSFPPVVTAQLSRWHAGVQDGLPDNDNPASSSVAVWAPEGIEPTDGGDVNARFCPHTWYSWSLRWRRNQTLLLNRLRFEQKGTEVWTSGSDSDWCGCCGEPGRKDIALSLALFKVQWELGRNLASFITSCLLDQSRTSRSTSPVVHMEMWEEKPTTRYSSVHINVTRQELWERSTSVTQQHWRRGGPFVSDKQSLKADGQISQASHPR